MKDISELISSFLAYKEDAQKRSARTVRNYDLYLRRFAGWLAERKLSSANDITPDLIKKYKTWLKKIKNPVKKVNLKQNTQNYHIIALREFFKYLSRKKVILPTGKKIKLAKIECQKSRGLGQLEVQRLLETPMTAPEPLLIRLRDRAVLEILYATGIKVSEAANLAVRDIDFLKSELTADRGGKKERRIRLANQAKHWLSQYLDKRKSKSKYVFLSYDRACMKREKTGLSARSLERIVEHYARLSGLKEQVTPQTLRNTRAYLLARGAADLGAVKYKMGYSSETSVMRYL